MVKIFQTKPEGRIFCGAFSMLCAFGRSGLIEASQKKKVMALPLKVFIPSDGYFIGLTA